jgi:hypothetical protein
MLPAPYEPPLVGTGCSAVFAMITPNLENTPREGAAGRPTAAPRENLVI